MLFSISHRRRQGVGVGRGGGGGWCSAATWIPSERPQKSCCRLCRPAVSGVGVRRKKSGWTRAALRRLEARYGVCQQQQTRRAPRAPVTRARASPPLRAARRTDTCAPAALAAAARWRMVRPRRARHGMRGAAPGAGLMTLTAGEARASTSPTPRSNKREARSGAGTRFLQRPQLQRSRSGGSQQQRDPARTHARKSRVSHSLTPEYCGLTPSH